MGLKMPEKERLLPALFFCLGWSPHGEVLKLSRSADRLPQVASDTFSNNYKHHVNTKAGGINAPAFFG